MIYIGFDYDLKDEDVLDEDDIDRGNNGVNAGEDCLAVVKTRPRQVSEELPVCLQINSIFILFIDPLTSPVF